MTSDTGPTGGKSDISSPSPNDPYSDTADRLASQIETQVSIINGIDDKSEHVTRLVGILVGLVFSVLSLGANYDGVAFQAPTAPVAVAFVLGVVCLLLSMGAAIVTYLSSRFRIGLNYTVGYHLSNPENHVNYERHIRRVCGTYGKTIEKNKAVIETNSKRFRRTLYLLVTGVLLLSTAGLLHLGTIRGIAGWLGLAGSGLVCIGTGWYILTGRYLTLEDEFGNNE